MSTSTDAILGWGHAWDSEVEGTSEAFDDAEEEIAKEFDVTIGSHCSDSCRMLYVGVEVKTANRGYPVLFDTLPEIPADAEQRIRGAIDALRVAYAVPDEDGFTPEPDDTFPIPEKLGWFLVSDWC